MKKIKRSIFYIIFILIIFLLLIDKIYSQKRQLQKSDNLKESNFMTQNFEIGKETKLWSKKIDKIGVEKAYQEFSSIYENKDITTQHIAGHLFGNLIYEKKGLKELGTCGNMLGFGCYHVFVARTISEKGLEGIKQLDKICLEKFGLTNGECQHGIGHGLAEYFGSRQADLFKALTACKQTSEAGLFSGCSWGVFMEYNVQVKTDTKRETAALRLRKFDEKNPYDPCPKVPQELQNVCYAQLPLWWDKILEGDFKKIGQLCQKIADKKNKETCFFGTGMVEASLNEYDIEKTLKICREMPDPNKEFLCRLGGRLSFRSHPKKQFLAPQMCEGLEEKVKKLCLEDKLDNLFRN